MGISELTELENRLLKWISQSDFEEIPWSTKRAAKAFKVEEKEILVLAEDKTFENEINKPEVKSETKSETTSSLTFGE